MSLSEYTTHVACTKKRCKFVKEASTAGFARLYAMRHFEQTGHTEFHAWRRSQEILVFPEAIKEHAVLRQNHHE